MTVAEYLAFEERSAVRHEFYRGDLFAMTGGTDAHSRLKVRLVALLDAQTKGSKCRVYDADMRVLVVATGLYTYPDASVGCDTPRFDMDKRNTLLNPRAVFEVLSKSSQTYDRGEKFEHYCQIPSLHHYVLVSQARRRVEVFTRDDEGNWRFAYADKCGDILKLEFINCQLVLDDLYEDIDLASDEELRGRPAEHIDEGSTQR
jgi:Uma2 family endonuclease